MDRRAFVAALSAAPVVLASPALRAQERAFTPTPGRWRTFEVVTRLEIAEARGAT